MNILLLETAGEASIPYITIVEDIKDVLRRYKELITNSKLDNAPNILANIRKQEQEQDNSTITTFSK